MTYWPSYELCTHADIYKPDTWRDNALLQPEPRQVFAAVLAQGWTDALRKLYPEEKIYTFWDYFRNAYGRDAGLQPGGQLPQTGEVTRDRHVDEVADGVGTAGHARRESKGHAQQDRWVAGRRRAPSEVGSPP